MARFDWDRLRRVRPLDGADARVDPDGAVVWERSEEENDPAFVKPLNAKLLRAGIVVRRAKERAATSESEEMETAPPVALERCPRCQAMVSRRRMFRHARVACRGRGRGPE